MPCEIVGYPNIINIKVMELLCPKNPSGDVICSLIRVFEWPPVSSPKPTWEPPGEAHQFDGWIPLVNGERVILNMLCFSYGFNQVHGFFVKFRMIFICVGPFWLLSWATTHSLDDNSHPMAHAYGMPLFPLELETLEIMQNECDFQDMETVTRGLSISPNFHLQYMQGSSKVWL